MKAVFLDRDGVINRTIMWDGKPRAPRELANFEFFPGVPEAITRFKAAGFLVIVVTNQPDVARGWMSVESVESMNRVVSESLGVDGIKVCYHLEQDDCACRKPRPGMLLEAAAQWSVNLSNSFMVGDRLSDIAAGQAVGCKTVLIGQGDADAVVAPDFRASSLIEASTLILSV